MTLSAIFESRGNKNTLALSASKRTKCLCGKRAQSTLMSRDGQRRLAELCMKCGIIVIECLNRSRIDSENRIDLDPALREFILQEGGVSSCTIISVLLPEFAPMCRAKISWLGSTPCDPGDFGRCCRALKLIENGVERLPEVAVKYPRWVPLVEAWADLTALYEEELPSDEAPKLYARMKEMGL